MVYTDASFNQDVSGLTNNMTIINGVLNDHENTISDLQDTVSNIEYNLNSLIDYFKKYGNSLKTRVTTLYAEHI